MTANLTLKKIETRYLAVTTEDSKNIATWWYMEHDMSSEFHTEVTMLGRTAIQL